MAAPLRYVLVAALSLTASACRVQVSAQVPSGEPDAASSESAPAAEATAPLVFVETEGDALGAPEVDPEPVFGTSAVQIAALSEEGSSSAWDEEVTRILLRDFDVDNSGQLDNEVEISRIPCDVYLALDDAVTGTRGGSSITAVYGFDVDYIWVGNVIGFEESERAVIAKAMARCGLPFDTPP